MHLQIIAEITYVLKETCSECSIDFHPCSRAAALGPSDSFAPAFASWGPNTPLASGGRIFWQAQLLSTTIYKGKRIIHQILKDSSIP